MATDLALPHGTVPSNLQLPAGARATMADSDVYGICERVKEVSPDLKVLLLEGGGKFSFAIMETAKDGNEMLVMRVKELDNRVVERLRWMLKMPLKERMAQAEKDEYKFEAERVQAEHEELYDRVGRPMLTQLEHDGFIQRPISYPKRGVAGGKGSAGKS